MGKKMAKALHMGGLRQMRDRSFIGSCLNCRDCCSRSCRSWNCPFPNCQNCWYRPSWSWMSLSSYWYWSESRTNRTGQSDTNRSRSRYSRTRWFPWCRLRRHPCRLGCCNRPAEPRTPKTVIVSSYCDPLINLIDSLTLPTLLTGWAVEMGSNPLCGDGDFRGTKCTWRKSGIR